MRQRVFLFLMILLLCALCAGCTANAATSTPTLPGVDQVGGICSIDPQSTCGPTGAATLTPEAAATSVQPVLFGTWEASDQVGSTSITISETAMDLVMTPADGSGSTELHYEVRTIDWAKDLLTLTLISDKVDGQEVEITQSDFYMKIMIDDTQFYYWIDVQPPEQVLLGPLTKK